MAKIQHYLTDVGTAFMVGLALFDYMPKIAAMFGALWYCIEIWEWWRNRNGRV